MIRYRVAIRRNDDGRVHVTRWEDFNGDLSGLEFWWMEGNMACDCNRHHQFESVADDEPVEWDDRWPCGETAYSVTRFEIEGLGSFTPRQLSDHIIGAQNAQQ